MKSLMVAITGDGLVLICPDCGPVDSWAFCAELADIGAAEQDHATEHVAALGGVS